MKNVIIIGSSGHAKVITDIIEKNGDKVLGFFDGSRPKGEEFFGYPILGNEIDDRAEYEKDGTYFIIGIGDNVKRKKLAELLGFNWYTAIHPSAQIGKRVEIGEGTVVMANAIVNPDAKIGRHCIVNTAASVDHDDKIGDYVHISPNAALAGNVTVGEGSHIGIGTAVIDGTSICPATKVGAGAVIIKDITEPGVYVGVPVQRVRKI